MSDPVSSAAAWTPPSLNSLSPAMREKTLTEAIEEARARGYQAGLEQGMAEARQRGQELAGQLNTLWESMQAPLADFDIALQEDLLGVVLAISRAVIKRELQTDVAAIEATLAEALAALGSSEGEIEVTGHPDDIETLDNLLQDQRLQAHLVANPGMVRGGARLRRGRAVVDASIEHRIKQAIAALAQTPETEGMATASLDPERIASASERFTPEATPHAHLDAQTPAPAPTALEAEGRPDDTGAPAAQTAAWDVATAADQSALKSPSDNPSQNPSQSPSQNPSQSPPQDAASVVDSALAGPNTAGSMAHSEGESATVSSVTSPEDIGNTPNEDIRHD